MSKNIKTFIKVLFIFLASVALAWITKYLFGDLYMATLTPVQHQGIFVMIPTDRGFAGFLIAYSLFTTLFTFLSIEKDIQRWVLALLIGPLLVLMLLAEGWNMFPWFAVATLFSFLIAQIAHFAIKKFKTT